MKNVAVFPKLIIAIAFLALCSCDDPDVSVATLGRKLSAPQLKAGTLSPFEQSMDTQKYVRIQGVCDVRVGDISMSFDGKNWVTPPPHPIVSDGTTTVILPPEAINDTSCLGDGSFDLWITQFDLVTLWNINPNGDNNVTNIYIKGTTLLGDTDILDLHDTKGDGGGNNGGDGTTLTLEKPWPKGFAGAGQCDYLNLVVTSANGNMASSKNSVDATISLSVSGAAASGITVYNSASECLAGTPQLSKVTIPAYTNNKTVYYKFPTETEAGATLDVSNAYKFKPQVVSGGLIAQTSTTDVTLRTSTRDWFEISTNGRIMANFCGRVSFQFHKYNGSYGSSNGQINLAWANPDLTLYNSYDCTGTPATSVNASTGPVYLYAKYSNATVFNDFLSIAMNATGSPDADYIPGEIDIDRSSKTTPTNLDLRMPPSANRGSCQNMSVAAVNDNWTEIPVSADTIVNLGHSQNGTFYSSASCMTGYELPQLTIPTGSSQVQFYYQANPPSIPATGIVDKITLQGVLPGAATSVTTSRDLVVFAMPDTIFAADSTIKQNICTELPPVYLADHAKNAYQNNTGSPLNISYNVYGSGTIRVYSDATCDQTLSTNGTAVIAMGATYAPPMYVRYSGNMNVNINYQINQNNINGYIYPNSGLTQGARVGSPTGLATDSIGNLYFVDTSYSLIRKVDMFGNVLTIAGVPGTTGFTNGSGFTATFSNPTALAVDSVGNIYVTDSGNNAIRKIDTSGMVSTLAGTGAAGFQNGSLSTAQFNSPNGIAIEPSTGNIFVADTNNDLIRKIDISANQVSTFAGQTSVSGILDGVGVLAQFFFPMGITFDSFSGNFYVADSSGPTVRKIGNDGTVTTVAGNPGTSGSIDGINTGALFMNPTYLTTDSMGRIFVTDSNQTIRRITISGPTANVQTIAGMFGNTGSSDGLGTSATFNSPTGITLLGGRTYISDTGNHTIRWIDSTGFTSIFVGTVGQPGYNN